MKFKSLLSTAALALILASCAGEGTDSTKTASAPDSQAKADSLVYCFGQMRGSEYLREAQRDTTLDSEIAKKEYLRGVKAGLDAVKADKEAYNKGLLQGYQMAMNINQFKEDHGIRLSDKVFLDGMSDVIMSDSIFNTQEMQANFYRLMNEFTQAKEQRDKEAAQSALKAAGEALNMKPINDQLWGTLPLNGAAVVKDGDKVKLDVNLVTLSGQVIDSPFPKELVVGQRMSTNPLSEAIRTLTSDQTGSFVTSAQALFGARAQQLGLKPSDILKMTVTPTIIEKKAE